MVFRKYIPKHQKAYKLQKPLLLWKLAHREAGFFEKKPSSNHNVPISILQHQHCRGDIKMKKNLKIKKRCIIGITRPKAPKYLTDEEYNNIHSQIEQLLFINNTATQSYKNEQSQLLANQSTQNG